MKVKLKAAVNQTYAPIWKNHAQIHITLFIFFYTCDLDRHVSVCRNFHYMCLLALFELHKNRLFFNNLPVVLGAIKMLQYTVVQ